MIRSVKVEVRLRHDAGHLTLSTHARSVADAVEIILSTEGAPRRAIRRIRVLSSVIYR